MEQFSSYQEGNEQLCLSFSPYYVSSQLYSAHDYVIMM